MNILRNRFGGGNLFVFDPNRSTSIPQFRLQNLAKLAPPESAAVVAGREYLSQFSFPIYDNENRDFLARLAWRLLHRFKLSIDEAVEVLAPFVAGQGQFFSKQDVRAACGEVSHGA